MHGLLWTLGLAAGFGAIVSITRARGPFSAWCRATGERAGSFLPAVWFKLATPLEGPPELEQARRAARFWIGCALGLLVVGLTLTVAAAIAT